MLVMIAKVITTLGALYMSFVACKTAVVLKQKPRKIRTRTRNSLAASVNAVVTAILGVALLWLLWK